MSCEVGLEGTRQDMDRGEKRVRYRTICAIWKLVEVIGKGNNDICLSRSKDTIRKMERTLRKHGRWVTNAVAQVRVVW